MPNPSAEAIIGLSRDLMREEAGSDLPVVSDEFLFQALTDIDFEVRRAFRKNGNGPVDRALEDGFTLTSETAVNNAAGVLVADATVTVDSTTGFDSSGAAVIWTNEIPDVFFYTDVTATTFTGVTGLAFTHNDGDAIQPLYALASNFGNFRRSEDYGDGAQLNGDPLTYMEGPPRSGHFSRRSDGTTSYLWLPRGATGAAGVLFDRNSDEIDSSDDLISFGPEWKFFYAWRCIELGVFGSGIYPIMALAKAKGDALKLDLLKDRNVGRRLRIRPHSMTGGYRTSLPDLENE